MTDIPDIKNDIEFDTFMSDVHDALSTLAPSTENTEVLKKIVAMQRYAASRQDEKQISAALCIDRAYQNAMEVIRIIEFNLHIRDKLDAAKQLVNSFEERKKVDD